MSEGNDEILFCDEPPDTPPSGPNWRVLIVDDEIDVHQTTVFAMRGLEVLGRTIEFLHAYSAAEACRLLATEKDIAVALLDVVMEEVDAGLSLARTIRDTLGLHELRIVLRTGQPGYAPEMDVIRDYDINDYKTKSDLTRIKLYTTLTAAIRSYNQLHIIAASRRGLDLIVRGSAKLMAERGINEFASGVITQITGLLGLPPEGLIIARRNDAEPVNADNLRIVAAAGRYAGLLNQPLTRVDDADARALLLRCLSEESSVFGARHTALLLGAGAGMVMAAYLDSAQPHRWNRSAADRSLLQQHCGVPGKPRPVFPAQRVGLRGPAPQAAQPDPPDAGDRPPQAEGRRGRRNPDPHRPGPLLGNQRSPWPSIR